MSLGSSDMAGSALGMALSLLLLASITQGLQDVEVFYYKKVEAVVGQNVKLPCSIRNRSDVQTVSVEWSKNRNANTKLAVHTPRFGNHQFWPNVTIQNEMLMGYYLLLAEVTKWDSGIYICDITVFPYGSLRRETELEIKDADVKIMCDMESTVEVHAGENVTIQCQALPNAHYRWTKNKKLVSDNESLELLRVNDAHAGVYTLTVNTGNSSLHKEFTITVQTATTSLSTNLVTVSPQFSSTESDLTTSPTTTLLTTDTNVAWTTSTGTDVTDDKPAHGSAPITAGENITSHTNYTQISVTSPPATHTDPYHFNSSYQEINTTHTLNTATPPDQSLPSNQSTTLSYGSAVSRSTPETWNEFELQTGVNLSTQKTTKNPGATSTRSHNLTINVVIIEDEETDGARSRQLLVLIIFPVLILIAVAGFLYRRQIIKERMDLPPPFKPPPPPIKYTSTRYNEVPQHFPTSRCNSVTEFQDMRLKVTDL